MADMTVQSRRLSLVRYHVYSFQLGALPFKAIQEAAGAHYKFQMKRSGPRVLRPKQLPLQTRTGADSKTVGNSALALGLKSATGCRLQSELAACQRVVLLRVAQDGLSTHKLRQALNTRRCCKSSPQPRQYRDWTHKLY